MEFTKPLENIIAASYLSGAGEAFTKGKTLTPEDVDKYLVDIKELRHKFLNRAESDGYTEPVHRIEEAKKLAADTLKGVTPPANATFADSLFGRADIHEEAPHEEAPHENVHHEEAPPMSESVSNTLAITDAVNKMTESINAFKANIPAPATAESAPFDSSLPQLNPSLTNVGMLPPVDTSLAQLSAPSTNVGMLPPITSSNTPSDTKPLLQLGGRKTRRSKKKVSRKKSMKRKHK